VIIVALLVLPLSLVRHRRVELAIIDKQILCLLSTHNKYANTKSQDQVNEDSGWEREMALWCGEVSYISPGQDS
jgi:hypothetical protein